MRQLFWIIVAAVEARSAAMGFNRIADFHFDRLNPHTRNRELPTGKLTFAPGVGVRPHRFLRLRCLPTQLARFRPVLPDAGLAVRLLALLHKLFATAVLSPSSKHLSSFPTSLTSVSLNLYTCLSCCYNYLCNDALHSLLKCERRSSRRRLRYAS